MADRHPLTAGTAQRVADLMDGAEKSIRGLAAEEEEAYGAEAHGYAMIRRMIRGERPMTVKFVEHAAKLLDADLSWVAFGIGEPRGRTDHSSVPSDEPQGCRAAIAAAVEVVFAGDEPPLNQRRADALRRMMIRLTHVNMRDAPWATEEGRERLLSRAAKALRASETLHLRPEPVASLADEIRWNRLRHEDPTGWAGDYYARFADAALAPLVLRETQDIGNHTAE